MFRNVANLQAENIGNGTLAQAAIVLSPNGPNAEGFPSSGPANGPSIEHKTASASPGSSTTTSCTPTPTRTSPAPASRGCAKPATRSTCRASWCVGNTPPGGSTNNRELTSREQNLFGEKYPSATLKALGLSTGKKGS